MALSMFLKRKADTPPDVAVLGAFRTGTNFMRAVLELNFDCRVVFHAYGWKHGFVPALSEQSVFQIAPMRGVFMSKSPLSFLLSLYRYHLGVDRNITASDDWTSFLRSPLTIYVQVRGNSPEYRFSTPIEYWNALNWNLHSVTKLDRGIHHCRYEDLLADPQVVVSSLADKLGLVRNGQEFAVPQRKVKRTSGMPVENAQYESAAQFDKSFYTDAQYLKSYSQGDLDFVKERLDPDLMKDLGYSLDGVEIG